MLPELRIERLEPSVSWLNRERLRIEPVEKSPKAERELPKRAKFLMLMLEPMLRKFKAEREPWPNLAAPRTDTLLPIEVESEIERCLRTLTKARTERELDSVAHCWIETRELKEA